MANNTYQIDYAKSGRSACKFSHCKDKIEKGELRLAKCFPSDRFTDGGSGNDFYHPKCWFEQQKKAKKTTKKIESEDDILGFDDIQPKDQDEIRELLRHKDEPPLFKNASKKKDATAPSTPKKASKQVYVDSDEENYLNDDYNKKPPATTNKNTNKSTPQKSPVKPSKKINNNNNNNNNNNSDGEESEDLEKDAWGTVAANGSRVAKTAISQISVLILGSASRKAIRRLALESDEDRDFGTFGSGSASDPDSWLQWLAGLGVLWISSDSSDAGFSSAGLWFDTLSMIVKQVFMAKPKKGIVVALWGSEVKHFKKEAQKYYQATMGTVHYRVVEGPTPLNDIFNPRDMVKKIDAARSELGLQSVQWWPHEGEIAHKSNNNNNGNSSNNNNNNNNSAKKKVVKQSSVIADGNTDWKLESADVEQAVELSEEPTEMGRALVNNKKISRKQCVVKAIPNGIELTPLGVNPMTLSRRGSEDVEILGRNEPYILTEGDSFTLCGEQYRFVLKRSDKTGAQKKTPIKKKEATSDIDDDNDNDKTRIGDDIEGDEIPEKIKKTTPTKQLSFVEQESATLPFSTAGYDDESSKEEEKEQKEQKKVTPKKEVKKEEKKEEKQVTPMKKKDVKMQSDDEEVDDEEIARKMQEEFDKESKKKSPSNTPKSKPSTPDKDEMLARKLQNKFNNEGGGGSNKKRKQDDDEDDEEVNWASKVKKQKKGKKGNDSDDDDGDWKMGGASDNDDDDDDEEYKDDEDEKPKNKNKKGGGGGGGSAKKKCMYGSKCYRTNPDHLKEYSHPK